MTDQTRTAVLDVTGMHRATEKAVVEASLCRRPGVVAADANPVSQTANVVYDPARTSVAQLADWVRACGMHCSGRSVPNHFCDPMREPTGSTSPRSISRRTSATTSWRRSPRWSSCSRSCERPAGPRPPRGPAAPSSALHLRRLRTAQTQASVGHRRARRSPAPGSGSR
jgi:copper chaperone CopZ